MQTVYSLHPVTQEAKDWIKDNVQSEQSWLGKVLVVEHRFIADIVEGMLEAGLTPNQDFCIW